MLKHKLLITEYPVRSTGQEGRVRFTKMQGAGNDYVYVNCFAEPIPDNPAALSRAVSDRHFGVGADGLILICPSTKADARMLMFNADGSEGEMCGNGVRCVAKYLYDHGVVRKPTIAVETRCGVLALDLEVEDDQVHRVRVDMGEPIFEAAKIPTALPGRPPRDVALMVRRQTGKSLADRAGSGAGGIAPRSDGPASRSFHVTALSMGNPHAVVFVEELDDDLVIGWGPAIATAPEFPRRTNVEFVQPLSADEIRMRVWERGSGETLACGTGACAAVVAAALTGRTSRKVRAQLRGGTLDVHWADDDHVYLTGPAVEVFSGDWPLSE